MGIAGARRCPVRRAHAHPCIHIPSGRQTMSPRTRSERHSSSPPTHQLWPLLPCLYPAVPWHLSPVHLPSIHVSRCRSLELCTTSKRRRYGRTRMDWEEAGHCTRARGYARAYRHGTFRPDHNVRTTKDLRQLWLRMAQVHQGDRLIHGPRDTILLDDSVHKARLQPNNHLALPTYGSAELRADADALTSGFENVDESLIAVVGILSEMRTTDVPFDEWNRTGRVWAGPGAKLDAREMWDGRIRPSSPSPPTTTTTPTRSLTSLPESILAGSSLSARLASRMDASVVKHEPDPPFEPSQQPRIYSEMPQWFSSPPLMRAWIEHGRQILDGLGIRVAHECVQAWPGWKEGNHEIQGKAKDDGLKLRKSDEQRKEKGRKGKRGKE
ncbi:NIF domain-containing protein [Rhizoctonia solani AG-1 IA]|uniref:NIF domain-containing protein n=1 Tax=Thanatephorus cucumeris (strain AG1-IA) TaxID=983506 RepID=L8WN57_THACA|nr:NIF domain-containing protein [Rhizoctonia solani AG-1 IA]